MCPATIVYRVALLAPVLFCRSSPGDFMVLLVIPCLESAKDLFGGAVERGLKALNINILTIQELFSYLCKGCQNKTMSCIPPSAFSAARIRETQRDSDMKLSKTNRGPGERSKIFTDNLMELSPLKYNSKLMNSIWGFYNRYSPHNVKKVNDANVFKVELPQPAGNSTTKSDNMMKLPTKNLDSVWASVNVSQSH